MPGGRPRQFETVTEFEEASTAYFEERDGKKISWTGLCLAVGVSSRQSLQRYRRGEHGPEFVDPIKKALLIVENYYEENNGGSKDMFVLKNFDWKDGREINLGNKDGKPLETKTTLEAGPGVSGVLLALGAATSSGQDNSDERGDQE